MPLCSPLCKKAGDKANMNSFRGGAVSCTLLCSRQKYYVPVLNIILTHRVADCCSFAASFWPSLASHCYI